MAKKVDTHASYKRCLITVKNRVHLARLMRRLRGLPVVAKEMPTQFGTQGELMSRKPVHTDEAPGAIGTYSQAIACGKTVYPSGQIPMEPKSMALVPGGIEEQIHQMFKNLAAVAKAAGGSLGHAVKVTIYMTDLGQFAK